LFVDTALTKAGVDSETRWSCVLIASELATNALCHARTDFEVAVIVDRVIRIEVRDQAVALPALVGPADDGASGRGMTIVVALASRWGSAVASASGGKVVWAEIDRRPGRP
jgi:anti-sigma regulatory factor (Ser/Thr protein kinase)